LLARGHAVGITTGLDVKAVNDKIIVTVPQQDVSAAETLANTALLRFRQVLQIGTYTPEVGNSSPGSASDPATGGARSVKPLPGSESTSLTPAFRKTFENWDCNKNPNPTSGVDLPTDYIIACDPPGTAGKKYLLAPASLEGSDITSADAKADPQSGGSWVVDARFTNSGAAKWLDLTKATYEVTSSGDSGYPSCMPPKGCNAIAITLDGVVQSDPATAVDGIPGGITEISGSFDRIEATSLAADLRYGALPVVLSLDHVTQP
jgi:preprotein translocase subunit SecD